MSRMGRTYLELPFLELGAAFTPCDLHGADRGGCGKSSCKVELSLLELGAAIFYQFQESVKPVSREVRSERKSPYHTRRVSVVVKRVNLLSGVATEVSVLS